MTDVRTELAHAIEEIDASPEEVFDALLDPESLSEWFRAPDDARTRDWRVEPVPGGSWEARTVAPDGTSGSLMGEIVTIDPSRTLELRWREAAGDSADSSVRFDLEPIWRGGERVTRITVTHVSHPPLISRVVMRGRSGTARERGTTRAAQVIFALRAFISSAVAAAR